MYIAIRETNHGLENDMKMENTALELFRKNKEAFLEALTMPLSECVMFLIERKNITNKYITDHFSVDTYASVDELIELTEDLQNNKSIYIQELEVQTKTMDDTIKVLFAAVNSVKEVAFTPNYTID